MSHLYVVQIGTTVKVGISTGPNTRFDEYRRDARRYSLTFEVLWVSPPHAEAEENERKVLAQFRPPGQRDEYLCDADGAAVVTFAKSLTFAPVTPHTTAGKHWINRHEGARILGATVQTLDRYIAGGNIRAQKTASRVMVSANDCAHMAQLRGYVEAAS